jgi:PTS system nitrogen regulatory IIA component
MLKEFLKPSFIKSDLVASNKEDAISELVYLIINNIKQLDHDLLTEALNERELIDSTGIESGIAIPHAKIDGIDRLIFAIARSKKGINFDSHDKSLTHLFFVLLAPKGHATDHIKVLARLAKILTSPGIKERFMSAKDANEIYEIVVNMDVKLG